MNKLIIIFFFILFGYSCNKKNVYLKKSEKYNIPKKIFFNYNFILKEKGIVKYIIKSPFVKEYEFYNVYPNGVYLFLYNNKKYGCIKADYMVGVKDLFYYIKGNVTIFSYKGYIINTEEIFWNRKKKLFFNEKKTIIYNLHGNILYVIKKGIEIKDNLKKLNINKKLILY
ncbi:hypothetical protein [Blattabacterium cuenoti]|uniref:hypothetical protein n=1 Tax=Blattabacterium cuenoti TaxID=1653831 RepID=UPI001EE9D7D6|nr:hypothetical protein [Blattabacterium cuenoti]